MMRRSASNTQVRHYLPGVPGINIDQTSEVTNPAQYMLSNPNGRLTTAHPKTPLFMGPKRKSPLLFGG